MVPINLVVLKLLPNLLRPNTMQCRLNAGLLYFRLQQTRVQSVLHLWRANPIATGLPHQGLGPLILPHHQRSLP